MTTKNICIWGDSIAYGAWDEEGGWADRLRRFLHARTLTSRLEEYYWVYNLGVPGETSDDLLKRFPAEHAAREPHIALFAVGINDSSHREKGMGPRVPIEHFRENINELLQQAKKDAEIVVCIGLTTIDEDAVAAEDDIDCDFRHEEVIRYDAVLRDASRESNVLFVDMQNTLSPEDLIDGLHPSAEGHRKMFEHILDFLAAHGVIR